MVRKNGLIEDIEEGEKFQVINRSSYDPEKGRVVKFKPKKSPKKVKPKKEEEVLSQEVSDITQSSILQGGMVFGNVSGQTVSPMSLGTFMISSIPCSGML